MEMELVMNKTLFVELLNALIENRKKQDEYANAVYAVFREYPIDLTGDFVTAVIEAIEKEIGQKDLIGWWLYDAPDAGNYDGNVLWEADHTPISVRNAEELWAYVQSLKGDK